MATAARDDESVTPALLVESLQTGTSPIPVHGDERTWPAMKRAILDPDRKVRDAAARAAQGNRRLMIDCLAVADDIGCRMLLYGSDRILTDQDLAQLVPIFDTRPAEIQAAILDYGKFSLSPTWASSS